MEVSDPYQGVSLERQHLLGGNWKVRLQGAKACSQLLHQGDEDTESEGN